MPLNRRLARALLLALPLQAASAATVTWDGGGASSSWSALSSTPGAGFGRTNWTLPLQLPHFGDDLVFAGSKQLDNVNDLIALNGIGSLTFAEGAGGFTLRGLGLSLSGDITNLSSQRQTVLLPLNPVSTSTWDGGTAGLLVQADLSLSARFLVLERNVALVSGATANLASTAAGGASLVLRDGSSLRAPGLTIASQAGEQGSLSLQAANTSAVFTGDLHVGWRGTGSLMVSNGAQVSAAGDGVIGQVDGSAGSVRVQGAGSALTLDGGLRVGRSGELVISGGGRVQADVLVQEGVLSVQGPGSALSTGNLLSYTGLSVTGGAKLSARHYRQSEGLLRLADAGTTARVEGTLSVGDFGQTGQLLVESGAVLKSGLPGLDLGAVLGLRHQSTGEASVRGAGSLWSIQGRLSLGETLDQVRVIMPDSQGSLSVTQGGRVVADAVGMNVGSITVSGAASALDSLGALQLGQGQLSVLDQGRVTAAALGGEAGSRLLLDGGTLSVGRVDAIGPLDWRRGHLQISAGGETALGAWLPGVLQLAPGMHLTLGQTLRVGSGRALLLGGGEMDVGTLKLAGGSVLGLGQPLDLSRVGVLRGQGTVNAVVLGGAGQHIVAEGPLTLGDTAQAGGVAFAGQIDIGTQQLVLLSADAIPLGALTQLAAGGRLAAVNGLVLQAGRQLTFSGAASVLGDFVNDGQVAGSGGALSFLNDVSGSGSFAGPVVFRAGYSPGPGASRVSFGGGDAAFAAGSTLTLQIGAGAAVDRLVDIGELALDGRLRLVFDPALQAAAGASHIDLLDFERFAGTLDPARIDVSGFDRARLDFSTLAQDGQLHISAVPEPASAVLLAGGLLLLAVRRRRAVPQSGF